MKKKVISLILSAAMIFSLCSVAFAHDQSLTSLFDSSVPIRAQSDVSKDLALIKQIGYTSDMLTRISVVNERLSYTFDIGGIEFSIVPTKTEDSVIYKITEGSICNLLEFCDNDAVILDGYMITCTSTIYCTTPTSSNAFFVNQNSPTPRIVNDYWVSECPYGSPLEYTDSYDIVEKRNFHTGQVIGDIALPTLVSLMCSQIPFLVSVAVGTVASIATYLKEAHPFSDALSYRDYIYIHATKGWWVKTGLDALAVKMHSAYLYGEKDFGGTPRHVVIYECRELDS